MHWTERKKIERWENNLERILENANYLIPNKIKIIYNFLDKQANIFFQQADTEG